jgi:catechol 2,3-dioxygenase-like lactoylglutathione lyase family enzyme
MEPVMKFLGVDHIDIIVSDLAKSIEYYRKYGMAPEGTVDNGETVFLWNGDDERPVRIELHKQQEGQKLGIDHLSFLVDDPADAQKEIEFLGGVEFLFEPFENAQSGRTISNSYDPDGVQIQMARQTGAGTYKNWE